MINPNDVNLIIFDMDGTIIPSLPAVYESIKRAFSQAGMAGHFQRGRNQSIFRDIGGIYQGGLYEFITPPIVIYLLPKSEKKYAMNMMVRSGIWPNPIRE